jgi:aspartate kinase
VVAVASARRGVPDHLLGLVEQVREAGHAGRTPTALGRAAADRAITTGEVVAASLLALALNQLGVEAVVLDARDAGLVSRGRAGDAGLAEVRPARLHRVLASGAVPVVTGFQGWRRGRVAALSRGGSDVTAVVLAEALEAGACELVKDPGAIHTADPRVVAEARPIPAARHAFVTALAEAGARIIHPVAAGRAQRCGLELRFTSLRPDGAPATIVGSAGTDARSLVLADGYRGVAPEAADPVAVSTLTLVGEGQGQAESQIVATTARRLGVPVLRVVVRPSGVSFLVPTAQGVPLLRALHAGRHRTGRPGQPRERQYAHR